MSECNFWFTFQHIDISSYSHIKPKLYKLNLIKCQLELMQNEFFSFPWSESYWPEQICPSFSSFFKWWTRLTLAARCRCSGVSWRRRGEKLSWAFLLWIKRKQSMAIIASVNKEERPLSRPYTRSSRAPWRRRVFLLRPEWPPGSAALFAAGGWCSVWSSSRRPEPRGRDLRRQQQSNDPETF